MMMRPEDGAADTVMRVDKAMPHRHHQVMLARTRSDADDIARLEPMSIAKTLQSRCRCPGQTGGAARPAHGVAKISKARLCHCAHSMPRDADTIETRCRITPLKPKRYPNKGCCALGYGIAAGSINQRRSTRRHLNHRDSGSANHCPADAAHRENWRCC